MLLPRFSLRTTLLLLTAGAVAFALTGFGRSGGAWGIALTAALVSVLLTMGIHALFYVAIASFARLLGTEEVIARTSQGALTPTMAAAPGSSVAAPSANVATAALPSADVATASEATSPAVRETRDAAGRSAAVGASVARDARETGEAE